MEQSNPVESIDQLEIRVSRAIELVAALRSECRALRNENSSLGAKLNELKQANIELSNQVNDLKIQQEERAKSFDREEVKRKIDHMLEKFGELQL